MFCDPLKGVSPRMSRTPSNLDGCVLWGSPALDCCVHWQLQSSLCPFLPPSLLPNTHSLQSKLYKQSSETRQWEEWSEFFLTWAVKRREAVKSCEATLQRPHNAWGTDGEHTLFCCPQLYSNPRALWPGLRLNVRMSFPAIQVNCLLDRLS